MTPISYNIVLFNPSSGGAKVAVEFSSAFLLRAGLKPDVNEARVSCQELAKLGSTLQQAGNLEFYFTGNPIGGEGAVPDLTVQNVTLVDVSPARYGTLVGQTTQQVVEWKVYFADFRQRFVAPRGGRLRWGLVNPSNGQPDDTADVNANSGEANDINGTTADPLPCSTLIQRCLDAMGISGTPIPTGSDDYFGGDTDLGVDGQQPPLDLQWHGCHAPTELQKLLDQTGTVFCPHLDGTASIEFLGAGTPPSPTNAVTMQVGVIDRRGQTVIFTSAPTPALLTETITGPSATTWTFVVQDTDRQWKTLAESPSIMQGLSGPSIIQSSFANIQQAESDDPDILTLEETLYYCIRLNTAAYKFPILRQRLENDGTVTLNSWWRPGSATFRAWHKTVNKAQGTSEAYPQQTSQQTKRTAMGVSGSTQPSVAVHNPPPPPLPPTQWVKISAAAENGGHDGTQTTPATWTYDITDFGGNSLAKSKTLDRPRPNGSMIQGSTFGLIFTNKGTLYLWDAGEVPNTGACTSTGS